MSQTVKIRRDGNLLRLFPIDRKLYSLLGNALTYTSKRYLATRAERLEAGGRQIVLEDVECFMTRTYAGVKHLITPVGYYHRIRKLLRKHGYEIQYRDLEAKQNAQRLKLYWDRVSHINLRGDAQKTMLKAMLDHERAQLCFPTGAGKSFLARILPQLALKARFLITTKHLEVLLDWYNELRRDVRSVGIWCSRKKVNPNARVVCVSAGSLGRFKDDNFDWVVADETQELATPSTLPKLRLFPRARMLALSANYMDRMDQADFELEGLFGPLAAEMTYAEAVEAELIVPINVYWRTVRLKRNPVEFLDGVEKRRYGLWRNTVRNRMIAEDARSFGDEQVLISVKTLEHALYLKQMLPEFEIVYGDPSPKRIKALQRQGLLPKHFRPMTQGERLQTKRDFENGKLKKVIATSVWNRGVNFHRLQVLLIAGGGASKIDATQIPGRLSRLCKMIGKMCGVLIDYDDVFDDSLGANSSSRRRQYKRRGWKQTNLKRRERIVA